MNAVLVELLANGAIAAKEKCQSLVAPTPDDLRWLGVAMFNLGQLSQARDQLLAARAGGCSAAGIELATAYRHLGRVDLASTALRQLNGADLNKFDQALFYRERGCQRLAQGSKAAALRDLEVAWELTFEDSNSTQIRTGIGQVIGLLWHTQGYPQLARPYLDASLDTATPARRAYLLSTRALCALYMGDFTQARNDLDEAQETLHHIPVLEPILMYYRGQLEMAQGQYARAREHLSESVRSASAMGEQETECFALLGLTAAATNSGHLTDARRFLARARSLANSRKDHAWVALREGEWQLSSARISCALSALKSSVEMFESLGLKRETGWATLHLAEAHLRCLDYQSAAPLVDKAEDTCELLGIAEPLALELRTLPHLQRFIETRPGSPLRPLLSADATSQRPIPSVVLKTFGEAAVIVDGKQIRLGYAHAVPIVAYLVRHQYSTMDRLVAEVLPDKDTTAAKNYFHQVRYRLNKVIPGLGLPYTPLGVYHVSAVGLTLTLDVMLFEQLLSNGNPDSIEQAINLYEGPFLKHFDMEWVVAERNRLENQLVAATLHVLECSNEDNNRLIDLGLRVLEVVPGDEAIGLWLLKRISSQPDVEAYGRHLERIWQHYKAALDVVPEPVQNLAHDLGLLGRSTTPRGPSRVAVDLGEGPR